VTSGLGGIYPPSLVVGTVTSVVEGPLTMDIRVDLAVKYSAIAQVFVITGRDAGPRPTPEDRIRILRELGLIEPELIGPPEATQTGGS
jgi:cell shape-determining protein MreC